MSIKALLTNLQGKKKTSNGILWEKGASGEKGHCLKEWVEARTRNKRTIIHFPVLLSTLFMGMLPNFQKHELPNYKMEGWLFISSIIE